MDFALSEEQQLIRNSVRDFSERYVKPGVKQRDQQKSFPHDIVQQLGERGFLGMIHPPAFGGGGVDNIISCLAIEEFVRCDASLALTVASPTSLGSGPMALAGNEEHKKQFLSPLADGKNLAAW